MSAPPKVGRPHVLYCLDLYQRSVEHPEALEGEIPAKTEARADITRVIESQLRRTSLVPVISDFLFHDADRFIRELSLVNSVHDVLLLIADVRFAYELPGVSDGWVQAYDMESGESRVLSRRELARLATRVDEWQQTVMQLARDADLDILRVGLDRWEMETTLINFAAERRLRKH
jgi:hypothetical protein